MNGIRDIFKNKTFLLVFSILVAILGWFIVVTIVSDEGSLTVQGVPVNINVQASVLGKMGLNPIEGGETTVEAVIYGKRSVIGGVTVEDVTVTASLAGVSGAGTYKLELVAGNDSGKEFEVISISPQYMDVKFDKLGEKTIPVEYALAGDYTVAEGYLQQDVVLEPAEITIKGPENDIAAIKRLVVTPEFTGQLTQSTTAEAIVSVQDKDGNEVALDPEQITLSADTVKATIPLLKVQELPVRFEYLNVPYGFPIEQLKYSLSADTITVAGPTGTAEGHSDIMVGYVDISRISLENTGFVFNVELPEGYVNTENVEVVQVDFDLTGFAEQNFYVSNFVQMNVPVRYSVNVAAQQVTVKLLAPEDVLSKLTAGDVVAEVDISDREVKTGQYMTPLTVYIPNGVFAWAVGDYEAAVTVRER